MSVAPVGRDVTYPYPNEPLKVFDMKLPPPSELRLKAHDSLRTSAKQITDDPQMNSVFALARSYFGALDGGEMRIEQISSLTDEIYLALMAQRAEAFHDQHFPQNGTYVDKLGDRLRSVAGRGWDSFKSEMETPSGGIVFTAHPTFALPRDVNAALAAYAQSPNAESHEALQKASKTDAMAWSQSITLLGEHADVQDALENAQAALQNYAGHMFDVAQTEFPDTWRDLRPALPTLASWVGYDLDGRTDINWWQSFQFRLLEKSTQLQRYADMLTGLLPAHDLVADLQRAADRSAQDARLFEADLSQPENLVRVVRAFETEAADRILNADEITARLTAEIASADDKTAKALMVLRAQIDVCQLGTARIHLRVNAAQVRAVLSRDLGLETEHRDLGRVALQELSKMAAEGPERKASFADLFLEQSTARRQILMCALWFQHIDSGSPIRFLIAEAENPATVMGTLYLARQYGIEDKLDISPLFETPEALETGGRFIARLLEEPAFLSYVRTRGQLSIQLGFSDAGRFIGQVAADMAIERIHNLIRQALMRADPTIALLIFNTHGESMGRGAWPGDFEHRFGHVLSHWTRLQARQSGVNLRHEVSFQGGDGYLHFATPKLAEASYFAWCYHALSTPNDCSNDPFYTERDFSWDTYRSLRSWHERLFEDADYGYLLNDFATNFLIKAGSRQRRRSGGPQGPRALRAISHNATLQQLGVPVNTAAGIGSAVRRETSNLIDLVNRSDRMRSLIDLALKARLVTSVPALRAYARVYDPGYWVAISHRASADKSMAYRRVYYSLNNSAVHTSINRIADRFTIDLGKFDRLLGALDDAPSIEERHESRLDLHVLHAMRQALMMHALSLAAQVPSLSSRHDTSMEDLMRLVREMRIKEAADLLQSAFPQSTAEHEVLKPLLGAHASDLPKGYDALHSKVITPLHVIAETMHKLTLAVAQAYRAYG